MRLCRFRIDAATGYGIVDGEEVRQILSPFAATPVLTGARYPLSAVTLLAPCVPGKIVCVGLNYRSHALDGHPLPEEPILFLKPASAATGAGASIPFPAQSRQVDFEGELALVIGRSGYHLDEAAAAGHILGYCCANDVTARDIQERERNFGRAKSFCGFAPFGPWIETDFDPADFRLETRLNGELKQRVEAEDLLFTPAQLVTFISRVMPLDPGDLILTGTPRGMGPMQPGDRVSVSVSGIGTLENRLGYPSHRSPSPCEEACHAAP